MLEASQRDLDLGNGANDEADFEKVGSYLLLSNNFSDFPTIPVDCFNIRVGDALKKFPELAEQAIQAEIQQMVSRGVFKPVNISEVPRDQQCSKIYSSMFLKEKFNIDGSLKKLKARLVAGGNMQNRNLYEEDSISSPTVSVPAVLIVAALGANQGSVVLTIDFPGIANLR